MENVIFERVKNSGHIILNRPEKINSLTHDMILAIDEKMKEWESDENISFIIMYGAGKKGFSAGGDMRVYYDNKEKAKEIAEKFFPSEYDLDLRIINYQKPIIALLDGIVMGGGVGISFGATYKIVTESTKWGMPEVNIGFFPDVGGTFFLNQISEDMARYISFLAKFLTGDDVIYLNYADIKVEQKEMEQLIKELSDLEGENLENKISTLLDLYKKRPGTSYLYENEEKIKKYFSGESVEEIINKLQDGVESNDLWAIETLNEMKKKSLLSQYIIFQQLKKGKKLTIEECFKQEVVVSVNFMDNPDFYEGLRSILVDKNEPNWKYKEPSDISKELVENFFIKKRP